MEYSGSELVSYNAQNNSLAVQGKTNDFYYHYPDYWQDHYHYYPMWYPSTQYITEKSKVEQGFKIVAKMLENKIITKELTIKEFIKLVNDIAEIL